MRPKILHNLVTLKLQKAPIDRQLPSAKHQLLLANYQPPAVKCQSAVGV